MSERMANFSNDGNDALVPDFTPEEIELLFAEPAGCMDDLGFTAAFTRAERAGFPNIHAEGAEGDEARARLTAEGQQMVIEARAARAGIPMAYVEYLGKLLENF